MRRKKTYLFGIPVSRDVKWKVVLFTVLAILSLLFFIILSFFDEPEEVMYVMPESGLSQSLFDSQNMVYQPVEGYSKEHLFKQMPFSIDTVDGPSAYTGNGTVYNSGDYYFYYSECDEAAVVTEVVKNEMTDVLLLAGDKSMTNISILKQDKGYINGCEADYYIMEVMAYRGEITSLGTLCLYRLKVSPDIYESEKVLLVGCMNIGVVSPETYTNVRELVYPDITTMKFREDIAKQQEEMLKQEEIIEPEETQEVSEPVEDTIPETDEVNQEGEVSDEGMVEQ